MVNWAHRSGVLHCLVVLPDKSTMFVPAEWTNVRENEQSKTDRGDVGLRSRSICIGSISDLLQMRTVVDALLRQTMCLDHALSGPIYKEADNHAIETAASGGQVDGTASGVVPSGAGGSGGIHPSASKSASKGNRGNTKGKTKRRTAK